MTTARVVASVVAHCGPAPALVYRIGVTPERQHSLHCGLDAVVAGKRIDIDRRGHLQPGDLCSEGLILVGQPEPLPSPPAIGRNLHDPDRAPQDVGLGDTTGFCQ